jgi:hypothetical protein
VPFLWWAAHPWPVVWVSVILAPLVVVLLRVLDDAGYSGLIAPLKWLGIGVFLIALVLGVAATWPKSTVRTAAGAGLAITLMVLFVLPTTHVVLGRTECPARAGTDLGAGSATAVLEAWSKGDAGDALWSEDTAAAAWKQRVRTITLDDYRLLTSGCWERVAPVRASPTWHEFRVTVRESERAALSKVVVVHVASQGGAWKVTGIEGPLP